MNINRKINIISNKNLKSRKTSAKLKEKLLERGFLVPDHYDKDSELNICVGGDGSFLRAVHRNNFPSIPFVGVNTGHLGFFQEITPMEIDKFISKYINEEYSSEEIYLLSADIVTRKKTYHLKAVNEMVIKGTQSKVIHLDLFIDGNHLEKFSGDGLIISTPVGSTAHNSSAGGSIIYPTLKTLQITPLAPLSSKAYRSLLKSIIIPGDLIIRVRPEHYYSNSTLILNDGMEFKYDNIKHVDLRISKNKIYKLNFNKDIYWNNLKNKFL